MHEQKPPRLAERLLHLISKPHERFSVIGDFEEMHRSIAETEGRHAADRWYWTQVVRSAPMFLTDYIYWSVAMFRNYFTLTLRNLLKYKLYSFINTAGLAVGLACFILIGLFVQFEFSYDGFHDKADRIYRVVREEPQQVYQGSNRFAGVPAPMAEALISDFQEVTAATRINVVNEALIGRGDKQFYENGLLADTRFFDVFSFSLVKGDAATALNAPGSIILTKSLADRYFGNEDPMGKAVKFQNAMDLRVTGIVEDPPENAHFTFSYIVSFSTDPNFVKNLNRWGGDNAYYTYFVLDEAYTASPIADGLPAFTKKHAGDLYGQDEERIPRYYLQALKDIHLHSDLNFELGVNGDITTVYIFSAIALGILLIACINYVTLSTTRSATRAREIGVRKTIGAYRSQLIKQFLGESVLLSMLAVALALALVQPALPMLDALVERRISESYMQSGLFFVVVAGIGVAVGLLSGIYPALLLSSVESIQVLKGHWRGLQDRPRRLRNSLVVGQFIVTIMLMVSTTVISRQMNYIQSKEIGLKRDHVVVIPVKDRAVAAKYEALKSNLLNRAEVTAVSSASHIPTQITNRTAAVDWDGREGEQRMAVYNAAVNYDFIEMFNIEMAEGRSFSPDFGTDAGRAVLINETTRRQLGWETAVGKRFDLRDKGNQVVGVMKDFHYHALHQPVAPLALYLDPGRVNQLLVGIRSENIPDTIDFLKQTMNTFSPSYPFEYYFLDDAFMRMYRGEQKLTTLFSYFTGLALIIACLGLFGLTAFTADQRTREIGIRKVLGASWLDILRLSIGESTRFVVLAFILAVLPAYFIMDRWLQAFAYRVDLGVDPFLTAGFFALAIAWLTVSFQAVKAALLSPIKTLKYE